MVEFIREAEYVKIFDPLPEFSWIVDPSIRNQTAYQILVASSQTLIEQNQADIWDSGKVNSQRSTEVEYAGLSLNPDKQYFWMVKIWDQHDQASTYSVIHSFQTNGLGKYATTPNVFQSVLINPKKIKSISPGHIFIDFGKAAFGTLLLNIKSSRKDTLTIHHGEKLSAPFTIDRDPPGSVRYQQVVQSIDPNKSVYQIKLPSDPRNTGESAVQLPDSFPVIAPFRYCEIEGISETTILKAIQQMMYHHYFDNDASYFISSDTILNKVWNLCKYSMKATSFCGLYIDGDRERIPYEADALINQLGHYGTDREYSMARRTNEYFMDHPTWPTEWILQTVLLFYYDYQYTGNPESIKKYYEKLKYKTLLDLARADGLITTHSEKLTDELMAKLGFSNPGQRIRDIVDWPPSQQESRAEFASISGERDNYEMVPVNTVVNSFHFAALKLMSEFAGIMDRKEDSLFYRKRADLVKTSINEKLIDKAKGIYVDGENALHSSLHANIFPLAFGIVPEAYLDSVIVFIKSRGMACSVYGSQFLLDALYDAGEDDYAFSLLTATHDRSWWNMIRSGSTISMEAWDMKYKPNSDWNHAWGAVPANIIPRQLWGIKPLKPGFESVQIRPQLSSLEKSRIKVPTIRGFIIAEFTKERANRQKYVIHLPGNMRGHFQIMDKEMAEIIINNKIMDNTQKEFPLSPGRNHVDIVVKSRI